MFQFLVWSPNPEADRNNPLIPSVKPAVQIGKLERVVVEPIEPVKNTGCTE
jgi:hypothetical protein